MLKVLFRAGADMNATNSNGHGAYQGGEQSSSTVKGFCVEAKVEQHHTTISGRTRGDHQNLSRMLRHASLSAHNSAKKEDRSYSSARAGWRDHAWHAPHDDAWHAPQPKRQTSAPIHRGLQPSRYHHGSQSSRYDHGSQPSQQDRGFPYQRSSSGNAPWHRHPRRPR